MNEIRVLDLFSGIGGFSLGLKRAGGFRTVCYVEIETYCQEVLLHRMQDGSLDSAPIFEDIRLFDGDPWRGSVDLICGGFPCQDLSVAGKREGIEGARSGLWSEFARIIGEIRPELVIVENVPGLLTRGLGRVLGDLAEVGYDAEWDCIPASAFGAPHRRDRVWIVADAGRTGRPTRRIRGRKKADQKVFDLRASNGSQNVADTEGQSRQVREAKGERSRRPTGSSSKVADSKSDGRTRTRRTRPGRDGSKDSRSEMAQSHRLQTFGPPIPREECDSWIPEPNVGRVVDGISAELDCIRRILDEGGNDKKAKSKSDFLVWKLLRTMWEQKEVAKTSPRSYIERLRDFMPNLSYEYAQSRWLMGKRIKEEKELRDLWEDFYAKPFEEAQDLQCKLLERTWKKKRPKEMGSRVDRLKGLGNAIVPQIVEWIGRRIKEAFVKVRM